MKANPLFYSEVAALNRETDRTRKIGQIERPLAFAEKAHLIPCVISEMASAAGELPIVFIQIEGRFSPVLVVGIEPGHNLFVDSAGRWNGTYVPAYIRRYPFIQGQVESGSSLVCYDPTFAGFEAEEGTALFEEDGTNSGFLNSVITLVDEYAASANKTDAMCSWLQSHDLFRGITVEVKSKAGKTTVLHGFFSVDEAKMMGLSDELFLEMRKEGYLPAVYSHLLSLRCFTGLGNRTDVAA